MTENNLKDVAKILQEAILQKQNEQFKIITGSLKATIDDLFILLFISNLFIVENFR